MVNNFCRKHLWEVTRKLASVAQGIEKADKVIKNATLVNVCTKELVNNVDIAISEGRIALVGNANHCIGEKTEIIDATGKYVAPGFLDGHIHVESSMMTPSGYAKAVVPHGTVGIYMDPHEICNVLGLDGVDCMMKDSKNTPLKMMLTTPSCVPAVPGFEHTGSAIHPEDIRESMKRDYTVALGEMMNYPGILSCDEHTHNIVAETLKTGKCVTGHLPVANEQQLNAYIASGMRCDHEATKCDDILNKMRLGMYGMFREGSGWQDLKEVAKAITQNNVDTRFGCLVTDDTHPHTLINKGHLDYVLKRAVEEGIDAITAIQMVTINTATCFFMDYDLGSVTPGKCADIVILEDLKNFKVLKTIIDGDVVAENGEMTVEIKRYKYPDWATNTINLGREITPESFKIKAEGEKVKAHVIEITPVKTGTTNSVYEMKVENGAVNADIERDILKAVVFERHHATGNAGYGFVKGFNIKKGALAQTVAHDAHNLLVIGTNDEDMAFACNELIKCGGGAIAVCDGKVLGKVELPVAGLMSEEPVEVVESKVAGLAASWEKLGCALHSPFMTMAIIPLACIPEIRLTDCGYVDCINYKMIDLFEK